MTVEQRVTGLGQVLKELGVRDRVPFTSPAVVSEALTHSSYGSEHDVPHNERLEMLGDAVVGFLVAELLFDAHPQAREGVLTRARSTLVSEASLARRARKLRLGEWLALGKGATRTGEADRDSVLADAFEAVVAALYRTEGLSVVRQLIHRLFDEEAETLGGRPAPRDYKTLLQERTQARWQVLPRYGIVGTDGPEHEPVFTAQVLVGGNVAGTGQGATKKSAEQDAARAALVTIESWPA